MNADTFSGDQKILLTGARGFVGAALLKQLRTNGNCAVGTSRAHGMATPGYGNARDLVVDRYEDLQLDGISCVIHLAARVHVMTDDPATAWGEYFQANVLTTVALARNAAKAGVRRFIFISSVKVNGESTQPGHSFSENDTPAPVDDYGKSKAEAEQKLRDISRESGMEVVIIRPPLVYGPGVKANFAAMVHCLQRGIPLPLGAVNNRRSLVALDNLVDLIITCVYHPKAAGKTWMVSDGEDISTAELLRRMSFALKRPSRLISIPPTILEWVARSIGKQDVAQRLLASLQVDITSTRNLLSWTPPLTLDQGLQQVARHLHDENEFKAVV